MRYRLHRVAQAYPKYTPADYLLSDDPLVALIFEINEECAETALIVEGYARETIEEKYRNHLGKEMTRQVPKWTLDEILDPSFDPAKDPRIERTKSLNLGVPEREEVDADEME